MRNSGAFLLAAALVATGAQAQAPMSAIDWLSDSVATPVAQPVEGGGGGGLPGEAPVTGGAVPGPITVTPLDGPSSDAVGLLPASVTGLPRDLWGASSSTDLAGRLARLDPHLLPAMQALVYTLLLAELDPPADSDATGALFLARIDTLLALGAVEQAQALLERAGPDAPERFRRWFDAALLTGTENASCEHLRKAPDLAPTYPARIFCLARGGDWNAAALTLETGRALGTLTGAEDALLVRFLDAEIFEGAPPLPPPDRPTPLEFKLLEAIGEPLPTAQLPLAFSHADLHATAGWKAQLEAAERLARSGALSENRLLGLYNERMPAASGGIWDRVEAIQRLETALAARDPGAVATALQRAWEAMRPVELEAVLARLYAERLRGLPLAGEAGDLAFRIALLSDGYERAAQERRPETPEDRFLKAVARGDVAGVTPPDPLSAAIADGFRAADAPVRLAGLIEEDRLGEAILRAIGLFTEGARGDLDGLSDALALFRSVGLEDTARRAALQLLILDRRG